MSLTFDSFFEARGLLEGRKTEVNAVANIYWDADGNLRHGNSSRDRDAEVLDILSGDTSEETEEGRVWMIVPSRWVRHWLLFAHLKISTDAPGPINMDSLLQRDDSVEGGWRPKNTLLPPGKGADAAEKAAKAAGNFDKKGGKTSNNKADGKEGSSEDFPGHYRRISLEAWMQLVDLYGLTEPGFALAVVRSSLSPLNGGKKKMISLASLPLSLSFLTLILFNPISDSAVHLIPT